MQEDRSGGADRLDYKWLEAATARSPSQFLTELSIKACNDLDPEELTTLSRLPWLRSLECQWLAEPACAKLSLLTSLTTLQYNASCSLLPLVASTAACASLPRLSTLCIPDIAWPLRDLAVTALQQLAKSASLRVLKVGISRDRNNPARGQELTLADVREAVGSAIDVQWWWV